MDKSGNRSRIKKIKYSKDRTIYIDTHFKEVFVSGFFNLVEFLEVVEIVKRELEQND